MGRILVFDTAIATGNQGDEIIFEYTKKGMESILDEGSVYRLGTHIENFSPIQMLRGNSKINTFANMPLKFVFGTNLVSDDLFHLFAQWQLNPFNKKLYKDCVLVGVGRVSKFSGHINRYTQRLYDSVLSKQYYHSARDEETKQILEQIGVKAINTGCPTLWNFDEAKNRAIPTKKHKKAILTVSGHGHQRNPEWDQKLVNIVKRNYEEVYAWIQTVADEAHLNKLDGTEDIKRIYSLNKYGKLLDTGEFDYIGTRLHGGVNALQHNTRSIIVAIDNRARNFHTDNNLPIIEREDIEQLEEVFINADFKTDIHVDREAINAFLDQFKTEQQ